MSLAESVKFSWTRTLSTLICLLVDIRSNVSLNYIKLLPLWLPGLPPVMEAEHDGEGAGGQQLLVVVIVQAVGCCQGKSVANLRGTKKLDILF